MDVRSNLFRQHKRKIETERDKALYNRGEKCTVKITPTESCMPPT